MVRRRLTKEETELWHLVAEQTKRMHPGKSVPLPMPKPTPKKAISPRFEPFIVGSTVPNRPLSHDLKPSLVDHLLSAPLQMDRKAFGRMKRGKLRPEARLDLHGMTMNRAHPSLVQFILSAQASGKRLVLVITGKGKPADQPGPIPVPHGVLKNQVPHWLSIPPCAQAVLQISPAHISHGGGGALYVYLRRGRG
ncbi:MAG: Smr/MutS family protein [Rhodobacteraceae bacterium]|nr:Smr/MutS family protein [Paracoccaceae bacterium]